MQSKATLRSKYLTVTPVFLSETFVHCSEELRWFVTQALPWRKLYSLLLIIWSEFANWEKAVSMLHSNTLQLVGLTSQKVFDLHAIPLCKLAWWMMAKLGPVNERPIVLCAFRVQALSVGGYMLEICHLSRFLANYATTTLPAFPPQTGGVGKLAEDWWCSKNVGKAYTIVRVGRRKDEPMAVRVSWLWGGGRLTSWGRTRWQD